MSAALEPRVLCFIVPVCCLKGWSVHADLFVVFGGRQKVRYSLLLQQGTACDWPLDTPDVSAEDSDAEKLGWWGVGVG